MPELIDFLGIKVGALTKEEIIKKILEFALSGKAKFITYLNAHCLNLSFKDCKYKKTLEKADLVYAGGQSIVWASRLLRSPLPERVNILDFFLDLAKEIRISNISIYLLGGELFIVKKTEEKLKKMGLKILGSHDGFFSEAEEKCILNEINSLKPDILLVGMGVPKQEKWIYKYLNELDVRLCWAVGAAFDWLSSQRKRAPLWMVKCGLEWLHRLFQQPNRLWRRYLIGNIVFIYRILRWKIQRKV